MVIKRGIALAVVGASILTTGAAGVATAAYTESQPRPLRKQATIEAKDIAARATAGGRVVAVGWRERTGPQRLFVTFSTNAGKDFRRKNGKLRKFPVLGEARLGMSVDVCAGKVWVGTSFHHPSDQRGDSDVLLTTRGVRGGAEQRLFTKVSTNRRVRDVDVACLGGGLMAVAWVEKRGGKTRARVLIRSTDPLGETPSYQKIVNLETRARYKGGIAVGGTKDAVNVAWIKTRNNHLRVAKIPIVDGTPDPAARTLSTVAFDDIRNPKLSAHGGNVVLVYTDAGKLKLQASSDRGETWGPVTQLIGAGKVKTPSVGWSVALHGERIVVEAGANKKGVVKPRRIESDNLGATWTSRIFGNDGVRMGALLKLRDKPPLLRETWDNDGRTDTLRAQYET